MASHNSLRILGMVLVKSPSSNRRLGGFRGNLSIGGLATRKNAWWFSTEGFWNGFLRLKIIEKGFLCLIILVVAVLNCFMETN